MTKKFILLIALAFSLHGFSQGLSVVSLKCENKTNPLAVEKSAPSLSWQLKSDQRSVLQTAYRILVSDDSALLRKNIGNIWDSKRVSSSQSIQIKYKGQTLSS